ncbi:VOC family protein [Nocardioides sp.]|uniref:VOC family protein n=1 Tax=Nocardioides sp. TaxID=35761 RepID=UPI00351210FA
MDQPLGRYKDLCIDAVDPHRLGAFWAGALDLRFEALDDGDARLIGRTPAHTVWINRVPEPVGAKHRVHLDIRARSVDDVLALSSDARATDTDSFRWSVLADPESGEFCVFTHELDPVERLYEVCIDCADAVPQAHWWARALGGTVHLEHADGEAWAWVDGIGGAPFESLVFVPVPEPKTVKNRIHLDLTTPALAPWLDIGARMLAPAQPGQRRWHVLADPEGNEFCLFVGDGPS